MQFSVNTYMMCWSVYHCVLNDRPTFATFTCHLIIYFLDELVCIGD